MKQNRDAIYLGDILDAIRRIESYTAGVKKKEFIEHFMMQDAVMRQIEIIEEFQEQHSELPWFQMRGIRNKIVHDYRGINLQVIWDTVKNDLPMLKKQVQGILGE